MFQVNIYMSFQANEMLSNNLMRVSATLFCDSDLISVITCSQRL